MDIFSKINKLPIELKNEIYCYDSTYRNYFNDKIIKYFNPSIDNRLRKIDIITLISHIGIPFENISDDKINYYLKNKMFIDLNLIYNGSEDKFSYKNDVDFDTKKIATIVNQLRFYKYNLNYPITIFDISEDEEPFYDNNGNGEYHIRAFYYLKRNIYLSVIS